MSNIAELIVSNKSGAPIVDADWDAEEEKDYINLPVLESEDIIPIFWLLLFKKSDLKYYNDPDEEGKLPYLVTTIEKAKQNFIERIPELTKMISNIEDFTDESNRKPPGFAGGPQQFDSSGIMLKKPLWCILMSLVMRF